MSRIAQVDVPPEAVVQMVRPVRAGLIDVAQFELTEFNLEPVNDAVAHVAANAGPLRMTVVRLNGSLLKRAPPDLARSA